jgi:integrase
MTRNNGISGMVPARAVDGPTEDKLARRRFQRGRLIELQNGWSVQYYEDVIENGLRVRKRVQKFLGTREDLTKPQARKAAQDELSAVNSIVTCRPRTTSTFREFAKTWIEKCKTRNRRPSKPSTLRNWDSILDNHVLPVLGDMPLSSVDNQALHTLVVGLVKKKLSPQTITNIVQVAKLVKASAVDGEGEQLCPTKWNKEVIDMPITKEAKQPTFTGPEVTSITKAASGRLQMLCILLAASGLRAGELLGLEVRHFDGTSVQVEQSVWDGEVQEPKTQNAKRHVDLYPDAAALLKAFIGDDRTSGFIFQTSSRKPLSQTNLLKRELHPLLETLGMPKQGFHCFRRFRNTYLRQQRCPDGILKFWMGHSKKKDMSDVYDRSSEDVPYRKDVALAMGVGFELPKTLTAKQPKTAESGVIGRQQEVLEAVNA